MLEDFNQEVFLKNLVFDVCLNGRVTHNTYDSMNLNEAGSPVAPCLMNLMAIIPYVHEQNYWGKNNVILNSKQLSEIFRICLRVFFISQYLYSKSLVPEGNCCGNVQKKLSRLLMHY